MAGGSSCFYFVKCITMNDRVSVKDFEWLYWVNRDWRVRNKKRHIMSPWLKKDWYLHYVLTKDWKKHNFLAHRLIWYAFLDRWWFDIINHKNSIRTDNRIENLEWCDNSYNQKHSYAMGRVHARWNLWKKRANKYH